MIIEYIKPIDSKIGYKKELLEAAAYLKDLKRSVIKDAIAEVTDTPYNFSTVQDRISYKYDVRGRHTFILDGKELVRFQASTYKVNKDNEIVCSFDYKLLYKNISLKDLLHKECDGLAMRYRKKDYIVGMEPLASDFFHVNGSPYKPGEYPICANCGNRLNFIVVKGELTCS